MTETVETKVESVETTVETKVETTVETKVMKVTAQEVGLEYVDMLYDSLSELVSGEELTPLNVTTVLVNLMQVTETYPTLHGVEKKQLIMRVLEKYVNQHPGNGLDLSMIPPTIDMLVDLDRGKIAIKLDPACCLAALLGCLSSAQRAKEQQKKKLLLKQKLEQKKIELEKKIASI